ncbi:MULTISPECIES: response regulator [Thiorhodovibrio]|uniref:response regulator n=1 Tax=Thiorhodovibrio TaxID=61593 RepID=UPI0019113EF2|nr:MULTISPECIES: response regulator [Thiorhodovibrio]MBK5969278.1 two-component system response regulator BaeR [Thiorhodovibrio winogradskyi]WPL11701.1 Transcriptional regulatory protein BaeR [Thiorhodovibrio litoralis]
MNDLTPKTVLIVEDEIALADVLAEYLQASSFAVDRLSDGLSVVAHVREQAPDLILLDLMLPGRDGLEICRDLRTFTTVPIIMVTAKVEEIDRLLGLELGADDYVCKPFAPREVVARVKAQLRRVEMLTQARVSGQTLGSGPESEPGSAQVPAHGLSLDADRMEVRVGDRALQLTLVEFRLLDTLCRHPGNIYSRSRLIERLYDDNRIVTERTVDTHVKNLRKKLASAFEGQQFIQSVYGVGYRYEPEPG